MRAPRTRTSRTSAIGPSSVLRNTKILFSVRAANQTQKRAPQHCRLACPPQPHHILCHGRLISILIALISPNLLHSTPISPALNSFTNHHDLPVATRSISSLPSEQSSETSVLPLLLPPPRTRSTDMQKAMYHSAKPSPHSDFLREG